MIRKFLICRYFDRYIRNSSNNAYFSGKVSREMFVDYIWHYKNFREDIRDKFKRLLHFIFGRWFFQGQKGVDRMKKQREEIQDTIDECLLNGYLLLSHNDLHMNYKGREFVRIFPLPFKFFEACLLEYKSFNIFIFSVLGTGLFGTFFANWDKIWGYWINILSKFYR